MDKICNFDIVINTCLAEINPTSLMPDFDKNGFLLYCCPLKVSEQRDIHPQCCCNGIADDFSEGKPLS